MDGLKVSVTKRFTFEASHSLPNHPGKCRRNHGHSYKLEVTLIGDLQKSGPSEGMIMDFGDLTTVVNREVVGPWDHQFLNDLVSFVTTVENLACEIFSRLRLAGVPVSKVQLWETEKCYATVEG